MPAELTHLLEFVEGWRSSSCHALLFSSPMPQPPSTLEATSSRNASHCCVHFCSRFLRLWPSLSSAALQGVAIPSSCFLDTSSATGGACYAARPTRHIVRVCMYLRPSMRVVDAAALAACCRASFKPVFPASDVASLACAKKTCLSAPQHSRWAPVIQGDTDDVWCAGARA